MKQTIQWKNKSIQIDIGLILILILFGMTSCFAIYNSFNLIKFGSGSSYLYRQLFWFQFFKTKKYIHIWIWPIKF